MASILRLLRVCDRKRLRNRCFATATDINGCSVARSIEVTMVGTARSIEITKVSYDGGSSPQSTDVFLCYQRLRVACALCNDFQAARPRQTTERRLAPLYVEHMPSIYYLSVRPLTKCACVKCSRKTWRRCSAHYVYAIAKKEKGDASPQLPVRGSLVPATRIFPPISP